ncbi:MAG TPA: WD40 repeat domain-containing protein [Pirellulales bacterium]|nr:WD40 repeat domain-containing protein [Pirellulales bacterium]
MIIETPKLQATLRGHVGLVNVAAFSPDGGLLITAGGAVPTQGRRGKMGETLVWDVGGGKLAATLGWHRQAVLTAAISSDGETLATGSQDQSVAIWNIGRGLWDTVVGVCEQSLHGHQGAVTTLAFSPDGGLLATGDDQAVRLWDTRTWRQTATLAAAAGAACRLAFSPDGRYLAVAWRSRVPAVVWEVATREEAFQLRLRSEESFESRGLAFSPDGRKLAVLSTDEVRVWDMSSCQVLTEFGAKGTESLAYSPRIDCLATGGWDASTHAAVRLWDAGTGMECARLQGHNLPVTAVAFAPSGKLLASAGRDALVNLWDVGS